MNAVPIVYIEIPAPDMPKAIDFYSNVFGWTVTKFEHVSMEYWMFNTGDCDKETVGGAFISNAEPSDSKGPLLYLHVEDITAKLKEIEKAGGTIMNEKFMIPGSTEDGESYGAVGHFIDPNGNRMGLWSMS